MHGIGLVGLCSEEVLELIAEEHPQKYQEYIAVVQEREFQATHCACMYIIAHVYQPITTVTVCISIPARSLIFLAVPQLCVSCLQRATIP